MTLNSAHVAVMLLNASDNGSSPIGDFDGANGTFIVPSNGASLVCRLNQASSSTTANTTKKGYFLANRSASNAVQMDLNGSQLGTAATASSALPTAAMQVCARNGVFSDNPVALGHWGSSLTSTDRQNIYRRAFLPILRYLSLVA